MNQQISLYQSAAPKAQLANGIMARLSAPEQRPDSQKVRYYLSAPLAKLEHSNSCTGTFTKHLTAVGYGRSFEAKASPSQTRAKSSKKAVPARVRRLYHYLRLELGEKAPPRDVLRLAHALVMAHDNDLDILAIREQPTAREYYAMPLDSAFADGGWLVMARESRWLNGLYPDDSLPRRR